MKKIILILLVFVAAAGIYAWYVFNKPHRNVADEAAISVTAAQLFAEYEKDEKAANDKYLNKTVAVKGIVSEVKKNQAGKTVLILQSEDPLFGINCTAKEDHVQAVAGTEIIFKGICTGYVSDVIINDGMILNPDK